LSMLLSTLLVCKSNIRKAGLSHKPWVADISKAIYLSFIAYGITGMNVSLAYFELVYALIGLVVVVHTNELNQKNHLKVRPSK